MLVLRPTTAADLPRLARWEADADTAPWLCETGPEWHARALADPDQEHLVGAETADAADIVGFVVLAGLGDDDGIELRRLVVSPEHRGSGQGAALLRAAVSRAYKHHGTRSIWLDVKAANLRAQALYRAAGFLATERRVDMVTEPDGTRSDLIIMVHLPDGGH